VISSTCKFQTNENQIISPLEKGDQGGYETDVNEQFFLDRTQVKYEKNSDFAQEVQVL